MKKKILVVGNIQGAVDAGINLINELSKEENKRILSLEKEDRPPVGIIVVGGDDAIAGMKAQALCLELIKLNTPIIVATSEEQKAKLEEIGLDEVYKRLKEVKPLSEPMVFKMDRIEDEMKEMYRTPIDEGRAFEKFRGTNTKGKKKRWK